MTTIEFRAVIESLREAYDEDACWPWPMAIHHRGYGHMNLDGRTVRPHRAVMHVYRGMPLASKQRVLHSCDNPPCCNPSHLRLGTQQDNMDDKARRGRHTTYSDDQIDRVKALLSEGRTTRSVASETGVSQSHVARIRLGYKRR